MDTIVANYNANLNNEEFLNSLANFSFLPSVPTLNFKTYRSPNDSTVNLILGILKKIPQIRNRNILYNNSFVKIFYHVFWELLEKLGVGTQNFYDFIEQFVNEMNRITVKDYVIYDCYSTDRYNCGRAMSVINKEPSRFLIYNTDSKGYMDVNVQKMYLSCSLEHKSEDVDKKIIQDKYPKFGNRLVKEITSLSSNFKTKMENFPDGIKLLFKNGEDLLTFFIPLDYPFSPPFGTFNDMTISEIDIDWNEKSSLKGIVNRLLTKQKLNAFPKHKVLLCYLLDF